MESARSGKENKQQIIHPANHGILAKMKATTSMMQPSDSDDDEEDEWEAVEPIHSKQEKIKKEKIVEVNLEGKAAEKFKAKLMNPLEISSKKEEEERLKWEHCMRLEVERKQRELQEDLHRIHFLAFIAHLRFLTNTLVKHRQLLIEKMEPILGFSTLPTSTIEMGKLLREVFRANFSNRICINGKFPLSWYKDDKALIDHLCSLIERKGFSTDREIALLFFAYFAFLLELPTRICIAFNPMPRLMKLPKYLAERKPEKPKETKNTATKTNKKSKMDEIKKNLKRQMPTRSAAKRQKLEVENDDEKDENITSTDEDEHEISSGEEESSEEDEKRTRKTSTRGKKRKQQTKENVKRKGKKEIYDGNNEMKLETEPSKPEQNGGRIYWNEYWDEQEQKWISVDAFNNSVDVPIKIDDKILYVLAIDNDFGVSEVGGKYLTNFLALETRKLRTDPEWLKQTLNYPYLRVTNTTRQEREDNAILELLKAKPFPQKLAEYKNHPLYALKKDLLKFEAIYPEDQVPLGTISVGRTGEHEIFPRSAVHKLEGSLNWIKESRSIKEGVKPYKIVKARPKTNIPKEKRTPLTLDLYGYWQTEPYVPPEVVDGKIPRNEFGNIYMYKKEMLPNGCVHLQLNGIFNIARRLNLEAVPAVVGWEFSGGINHPILDGCVVLKNDEEMLRSAWLEMARNKAANEAKKNSERVWKNWRRLVRSKLLLEKMRNRFK